MSSRLSRPARAALVVGGAVLVFYTILLPLLPHSFFSYATRPLWDKSDAPTELIAHFPFDPEDVKGSCARQGWDHRVPPVDVWDVTLFSTEIDLLLLRLHELSPLVSAFYIMESSHSFTGVPKPPLLADALLTDPFRPFVDRIHFTYRQGRTLQHGEDPFTQENEVRIAMDAILLANFPPAPAPPPVMLFSDVDEIPSRETIALLKACDFGPTLHLGMREFVYSFAWVVGGDEMGAGSWRASAVQWMNRGDSSVGEYYRHSKVTEQVLVDSGWHCSWCFRYIEDFVTKAKGYSHVDRLGSRPSSLLRPERIQQVVCDGSDIFSMLPEAYSWREMAAKWRLLESKSVVRLPTYLGQHPGQFRYLLPGGCVRERLDA